tara:strand:+ start:2154 stop:2420 length:267 start_codon:yes stop_codon:yes gene_type:complete
MYSRTRPNQASGYGGDLHGEEQEHKGSVISISVPFHELDLIEEMDLQARMECCSSRSHYIRRLIRRGRIERLKAEKQHAEWVSVWGSK